jgi:hypothetical protein
VVRGACPAFPPVGIRPIHLLSEAVFPMYFLSFLLLYIDESVIEAFEMMCLAAALFSVDLLVRMSGCTEEKVTVLESKAHGNVRLP